MLWSSQLVLAVLLGLSEAVITPHFKWAQTLYHLYIVVTVKDLDQTSVSVNLQGVDHLSFSASDGTGERHELELPLREDVMDAYNGNELTKWDIPPRENRFGTEILITLTKLNMHRWDRLLFDPSLYRKVMEKDWARENASLEGSEEFPYQEQFPSFLTAVTEDNFNETIASSRPLLLNVKYLWCHACKKLDPIYVAVAKAFKAKAKKHPEYGNVTFGTLDPRENRVLARRFGAGLAPRCGVCEVKVLTEVGEEAEYIKDIEITDDLDEKIPLYMEPAVELFASLQDPGLEALKRTNVTCVGVFASEKSHKYRLFKNVSRTLRGDLKFAAVFGEEGAVEMHHPNNKKRIHRYEGEWNDNADLLHWARSHSMPLLQVYGWWVRKRYDALKLPIAKIFINERGNAFFNDHVRSIIKKLATEYLGKVAFVELHRSQSSYEMHDFMLDHPEVYPAFGVQTNNTDKAQRYGMPITDDMAPSVEAFWKNEESAMATIREFLGDSLKGELPTAHESEKPQEDWTPGKVRQLCWRDYSEITNPERPLVLELWNRFKVDRDEKEKSAEYLAQVLLPHADRFTIARYDTGVNYYLKDHFRKRTRKDTESWWYWIAKNESAEAEGKPIIRRLMEPKSDASARGVMSWVKKKTGLQLDIDELMRQHEKKMRVWKKFKGFTKLNNLGPHPESDNFPKGFNTIVRVLEVGDVEAMPDGTTELRTAVVGDETGIIEMRFQGEKELPLAVAGLVIEVRNAKVVVISGKMAISVGRFGLITEHDGEAEIAADEENNITSLDFRDKKGRLRDEL